MGSCMSLSSMGSRTQQSFQPAQFFDCAVYSTQNQRSTMEDTNVICLSLPKHPSYSLIGIFDGFNGSDASTFISENIVNTLDAVRDLEDNDAIIDAINKMDHKWIHSTQQPLDQQPVPNVNSGSTYVIALITTINTNTTTSSIELAQSAFDLHVTETPRSIGSGSMHVPATADDKNEYEPLKFPFRENGRKVRIFWAGDSRAMLMSNDNQFLDLTHDHHCNVEEEADRIVDADGKIKNDRIDGICEVTRGFGCFVMKDNPDLPSNKQKMIADAETTSLMCSRDDILVLYCDGVIKEWSDKKFKQIYKHHALQQEDEKKGLLYASMYVSEQAMDEGSKDNITLVTVKFK